jgi:hypothetical protein
MPRFISMASFRSTAAIAEAIKNGVDGAAVPVGQIIGHVVKVEPKTNDLPDGSTKVSWAAYGEFEGVSYKNGEVMQSGCVFLPDYYAQELKEAMGTGATSGGNLLFGVEIFIRATGKAIPYAYEVKNATTKMRSDPLQRLKADMARAGVLRLPYTPAEAVTMIEAGRTIEHDADVDQPASLHASVPPGPGVADGEVVDADLPNAGTDAVSEGGGNGTEAAPSSKPLKRRAA